VQGNAAPAANQTVERTLAQQEYDDSLNKSVEAGFARNEDFQKLTDAEKAETVRQQRDSLVKKGILATPEEYALPDDVRIKRNDLMDRVQKRGQFQIVGEDFAKTQPDLADRTAYFTEENGVRKLHYNKARSINSVAQWVVMHEMTHGFEKQKVYSKIYDLVKSSYAGDAAWYDALERTVADRAAKGETLVNDPSKEMNNPAAQELVADDFGHLFDTSEKVRRIVFDDRTFAQKVFDAIHDFLELIGNYNDPYVRDVRKAEKLLSQALKEADKEKAAPKRSANQQMPEEQTERKNGKFSGDTLKYWRPKLNRNEWSLLNRTMDKETGSGDNFLDDETKWLYKEEKGTTIFALYGVGDGSESTPLYASGGNRAKSDYAKLQSFEGKYYGSKQDRTTLGRLLKDIESQKVRADAGLSGDRHRGSDVGTVPVSGRQSESDGRRNPERSAENRRDKVKFSADSATYDDDGNIIPLSERFNPENEDIRWSGDTIGEPSQNIAWAIDDGLIDRRDQGALWNAVNRIARGEYVPKTAEGLYIVERGDKIMLTDGDKDRPSLEAVIELHGNWAENAQMKEWFYDARKKKRSLSQTTRVIALAYGDGAAVSHDRGPASSDGESTGRGQRADRRRASGKIQGSRDAGTDQAAGRGDPEGEVNWSGDTILSDPEVEKIIRDLNKTFGTIPKGEYPTNDIDLPRRTERKNRTRQFPRTVAESRHADSRIQHDIMRDVANSILTYRPEGDAEAASDFENRARRRKLLTSSGRDGIISIS